MLELFGGGILGSLFGGLFRLAPEVLKWLDRGSERKHELLMFKEQCALESLRGELRYREINAARDAAVDTLAMGAFDSAIKQQAEMVKVAGGWVASISAAVRPLVTYWILFVWSFIHAWFAFNAYASGSLAIDIFKTMMTPDFSALLAGTLNYWFLDRTLSKRGLL